jgi:hypothetical protein
MATKQTVRCLKCGDTPVKGTLFRALLDIAENPNDRKCKHCGSDVSLCLGFEFGLDAADKESVIERVFRPRDLERWPSTDGSTVSFYPFLVVLNRKNRERAVWLPYWHLLERPGWKRPKEKYGQWAPFMDRHLFEDLLSQARDAGLLDIAATLSQ